MSVFKRILQKTSLLEARFLRKTNFLSLVFLSIHTLSGEGDTALLGVNVLDLNLNYVTGLEELRGVFDVSVTHLGDVKKSIVVNYGGVKCMLAVMYTFLFLFHLNL